MTCIAARIDNGFIEVAADSAVSGGTTSFINTKVNKLIKTRGGFIGATGPASMIAQIRMFCRTHKISDQVGGEDAILDFALDLRKWRNDRIGENEIGADNIIVCHRSGLFTIGEDLCVMEYTESIAIGCGCNVAMGAMFHGATASEAVNAACVLDTNCCLPIISERVELK